MTEPLFDKEMVERLVATFVELMNSNIANLLAETLHIDFDEDILCNWGNCVEGALRQELGRQPTDEEFGAVHELILAELIDGLRWRTAPPPEGGSHDT